MTDADPDESKTPEQGSAEDDADDADESSEPAQEPTKPKPNRSTTLWVALAGIAATLIGTGTGSYLTYRTSADKIQADAKKATVEERRAAYDDFLNAESDEWNQAQRLTMKFSELTAGQIPANGVVDQWNKWSDTLNAQYRASSELKLVASPSMSLLADSWSVYDDDILKRNGKLFHAVADVCPDSRSTTCAKAPRVADMVRELSQAVATDSQPTIKTFDDVAQVDLGLSDKSVCHPDEDLKKSPAPWRVSWSCT